MKRITLFILLALPHLCGAQSTTTIYMDEFFIVCPKDSASYYRHASYDKDSVWHGRMKTYYMNGNIYSDIEYYHGVCTGKWTWWHINGQKDQEGIYFADQFYILNSWNHDGKIMVENGTGYDISPNPFRTSVIRSEGLYIKGNQDSIWTWRYNNGSIRQVSEFREGKEYAIDSWSPQGAPVIVNGNGMQISYHDEKRIRVKGKCVNGAREGNWKWYYNDGKIREECSYINYKLEGVYRGWYKNGKIAYEMNFHEGQRTGKATWWYWNGQKDKEAYYRDGVCYYKNCWDINGNQTVVNGTGYLVVNRQDGVIVEEGNCVNYEKVGLWKFYYDDGSIKSEAIYNKGVYYAYNAWDRNGNQTLIKGDGKVITYYNKYRDVESIGEYKDGLYDGVYTRYQENSDTMYITQMKNGEKKGSAISFFENGQIKIDSYYYTKTDYKIKEWYDNGQLMYDGRITDDVYYCWGSWDRNGTPQVVKGNGIYKLYYDDGTLKKEGRYKNGYKEGVWKEYYSNGVIANAIKYKSGKREGEARYYNSNGLLSDIQTFKANKLHGPAIRYYDNGKKSYDKTYWNDVPDKMSNYYEENGKKYYSLLYDKGIVKYVITQYYDDQEPIYNYVETRAQPYIGYAALDEAIRNQTRYWDHTPKEDSVDAVVQVVVVIEKDGSISNLYSVAGKLGSFYEEKAAEWVARYAKNWKPAIVNGNPVRSAIWYPVNFDTTATYHHRFDVKFHQNGEEVTGDTLLIMKKESFSIEVDFPESNANTVEVYTSSDPSKYNLIASGMPVSYAIRCFNPYEEKDRYTSHAHVVSNNLQVKWYYDDSLSHTFNRIIRNNNTLKCYRDIDSLSQANLIPGFSENDKITTYSINQYPYNDLYLVFFTRKTFEFDPEHVEYHRRVVHIRFE